MLQKRHPLFTFHLDFCAAPSGEEISDEESADGKAGKRSSDDRLAFSAAHILPELTPGEREPFFKKMCLIFAQI